MFITLHLIMYLLILITQGQVADGSGFKPMYWYVGDESSTTRNGGIHCMDENTNGDRIYGGMLSDINLVSPPLTGALSDDRKTAFFGLKKAGIHAFDDPQAWAWAVYIENGVGNVFGPIDWCFFTPIIGAPYNKQMLMITVAPEENNLKYRHILADPADASTGTFKKLVAVRNVYSKTERNRDQSPNYSYKNNVYVQAKSSTITMVNTYLH